MFRQDVSVFWGGEINVLSMALRLRGTRRACSSTVRQTRVTQRCLKSKISARSVMHIVSSASHCALTRLRSQSRRPTQHRSHVKRMRLTCVASLISARYGLFGIPSATMLSRTGPRPGFRVCRGLGHAPRSYRQGGACVARKSRTITPFRPIQILLTSQRQRRRGSESQT